MNQYSTEGKVRYRKIIYPQYTSVTHLNSQLQAVSTVRGLESFLILKSLDESGKNNPLVETLLTPVASLFCCALWAHKVHHHLVFKALKLLFPRNYTTNNINFSWTLTLYTGSYLIPKQPFKEGWDIETTQLIEDEQLVQSLTSSKAEQALRPRCVCLAPYPVCS